MVSQPDVSAVELGPDSILWDVVKEHLDEAEFLIGQCEQLHQHPLLTLTDLAKTEARYVAHVDGLVVGGPIVRDRLLLPALDDAPGRERAAACALALLQAGDVEYFLRLLVHAELAVREGAIHACRLASGCVEVEAVVLAQLRAAVASAEAAGLLDALAARGSSAPVVLELLQSRDPVLLSSALRSARFSQEPRALELIDPHLTHAEPGVSELALIAALAHGSPSASNVLARCARPSEPAARERLALLAALGGPAQHEHIASLLSSPSHADAALFALGYSGNLAYVPRLLEHLRGAHETRAKLAAQSLSLLVGFDLADDELQAPASARPEGTMLLPPEEDPEALEALPPFEEDDLDEPPLPQPEDQLPSPDAVAIERVVSARLAGLDSRRRCLAAQPYSAELALELLSRGALRTRHILALTLFVDSGGELFVDTHASTTVQRRQIARAASMPSARRVRTW